MNKKKLNLDELSSEMEILNHHEQALIVGGVAKQWEYAIDDNGNWYYREAGTETWYQGSNSTGTGGATPVGGDDWHPQPVPTEGGAQYGTITPSTGTTNTISPWQHEAFDPSPTSLVNRFEGLFDPQVWSAAGVSTMTGVLQYNQTSSMLYSYSTTVTNGNVTSYSISDGMYTVSFASNKFTISVGSGSNSDSIVVGLTHGLVVGHSFTDGVMSDSGEENFKPGENVLAGLAILSAFTSSGSLAPSLFPSLGGGIAW